MIPAQLCEEVLSLPEPIDFEDCPMFPEPSNCCEGRDPFPNFSVPEASNCKARADLYLELKWLTICDAHWIEAACEEEEEDGEESKAAGSGCDAGYMFFFSSRPDESTPVGFEPNAGRLHRLAGDVVAARPKYLLRKPLDFQGGAHLPLACRLQGWHRAVCANLETSEHVCCTPNKGSQMFTRSHRNLFTSKIADFPIR